MQILRSYQNAADSGLKHFCYVASCQFDDMISAGNALSI